MQSGAEVQALTRLALSVAICQNLDADLTFFIQGFAHTYFMPRALLTLNLLLMPTYKSGASINQA